MTVNGRLKYLRKKVLSLKQDEFGAKIKLTGSTISKIEAGDITLTDRNITAICDAFGVSEKWLLTGEGEPIVDLSTDQVIADGASKLIDGKGSFEKSMIAMMLQMDDEDWRYIKKFIKKMAALVDEIESEN